MSVLQTIKTDALNARKRRETDTAAFLTTLLSEAATPGLNDGKRDSSDEEVIAVVRKFLKNNAEVLSVRPNDASAAREKALLEAYLPTQMDAAALRAALQGIAQNAQISPITQKDMGALMKGLKDKYAGQYDGKSAQQAIAALIAQ